MTNMIEAVFIVLLWVIGACITGAGVLAFIRMIFDDVEGNIAEKMSFLIATMFFLAIIAAILAAAILLLTLGGIITW